MLISRTLEDEERFYEVGSPEGLADLQRYIAGRNRCVRRLQRL